MRNQRVLITVAVALIFAVARVGAQPLSAASQVVKCPTARIVVAQTGDGVPKDSVCTYAAFAQRLLGTLPPGFGGLRPLEPLSLRDGAFARLVERVEGSDGRTVQSSEIWAFTFALGPKERNAAVQFERRTGAIRIVAEHKPFAERRQSAELQPQERRKRPPG